MIDRLDISRQTFTLEGTAYTPEQWNRPAAAGDRSTDSFRRDLFRFLTEWSDPSDTLTVHTSGSTGAPKPIVVRKTHMMRSAEMTCSFLGLRAGDKALLCLPLTYIAGKMIVVRALVAGLDVYPVAPSGHPFAGAGPDYRFAALIPLQVYNSLRIPEEKERLERTGTLIIGGGPVDRSLQAEIARLPNPVYATYGMTETLSHIALRRLNGPEASNRYRPFPGVGLTLAADGTLEIDAPHVCDTRLKTNDTARLYPDGSFEILGRLDNVINSGGVKIQAEEVEERLRALLPDRLFAVTSQPDTKFGEIVVLLTEGSPGTDNGLAERIAAALPPYQVPKKIRSVPQLPVTASGKINRAEVKRLAAGL